MAESFEQKIEREAKEGMIPGAVLIAGDKEGMCGFLFHQLRKT